MLTEINLLTRLSFKLFLRVTYGYVSIGFSSLFGTLGFSRLMVGTVLALVAMSTVGKSV